MDQPIRKKTPAEQEMDAVQEMFSGIHVIHVTPKPVKCKHSWPHDLQGVDIDGSCIKCGLSFQRYIYSECP